jgi:hypothetical protein
MPPKDTLLDIASLHVYKHEHPCNKEVAVVILPNSFPLIITRYHHVLAITEGEEKDHSSCFEEERRPRPQNLHERYGANRSSSHLSYA